MNVALIIVCGGRCVDSARRSRRNGFTRAELLVVIAILCVAGVLVAPLIMPVSKPSHEAQNLIACQENLRKIGVGLLAYAQNNGGALPVSETLENPHLSLVRAIGVERYIVDPKVFYCPSETRPELSYSEQNFKAGVIGYFYYSAAQASDDEDLSRFLREDVSWPRKLKIGLDGRSWVMSDIWVSGDPTAHAGYRKGVNYLMLDGDVQFVGESPRQAFR